MFVQIFILWSSGLSDWQNAKPDGSFAIFWYEGESEYFDLVLAIWYTNADLPKNSHSKFEGSSRPYNCMTWYKRDPKNPYEG